MKRLELIGYGLLFSLLFSADRIVKAWVLDSLDVAYKVNDYLSFDCVLNRGISLGLFYSNNDAFFILLTLIILGVVFFLSAYAYRRWAESLLIIGEVFVLAGALSNIVDRVFYRGVIDFIIISYGEWQFPAFNIADMCIFFGVCVMCISVYGEHEK